MLKNIKLVLCVSFFVALLTGCGSFDLYDSKVYRSASRGDVFAQNELGDMYVAGKLIKQDYKQAVFWYEKSAKQGFAIAQYSLGNIFYYGKKGVKKNYNKALVLFQKASKQELVSSQFNTKEYDDGLYMASVIKAQNKLGYMYLRGIGIKQNYSFAMHWFKKATKQEVTDYNYVDLARSNHNLGMIYYDGLGVEKDYDQAYYLFYQAIKYSSNFAIPRYYLAKMYQKGLGTAKNEKKAVSLFTQAAKLDYAPAQFELGLIYYNGLGVKQDKKIALSLIKKASYNGSSQATKFLRQL